MSGEAGFVEALRRALPGRVRVRLERAERAAVLVPIIDDGGPLRLLLTRRTENVATHRGQVAFPGGFVEPGEDDPARTALRESREEIGLPPESVEVLGLLDDHPTRTDLVAVTPVVGRLGRLPDLAAQTEEVARIFTIPVADLRRPERWRSRLEPLAAGSRTIHFFDHEGEVLWGLSARIVRQLLDLAVGGG